MPRAVVSLASILYWVFRRCDALCFSFYYMRLELNATFSNILVISWQSDLLVEESGENHRHVVKGICDGVRSEYMIQKLKLKKCYLNETVRFVLILKKKLLQKPFFTFLILSITKKDLIYFKTQWSHEDETFLSCILSNFKYLFINAWHCDYIWVQHNKHKYYCIANCFKP